MSNHHYNFDLEIDRHGTGALKTDALKEYFGRTDLQPLWIADMDFAIAPEIVDAMVRKVSHPVYGYSGTPDSYWDSIITWLDRRHGFKVAREELSFIPGVVRGIAYAVNYFTRPGDAVVIQPPVYNPFRQVVEGNRRRLVTNPLRLAADGMRYEMDFDHLEECFKAEKPKMMILCNPHNPGGTQWDFDTLSRLATLCRRYGVIVVSDEIHGDLMLHDRRHIPFVSTGPDAEAVAVTLGAPSKTFNIPGLVSSWMIIKNPELRRDYYQWLECNEFSSPTFMATTATEVAYREGEPWLEAMLDYVEDNITLVKQFLAEHLPDIRPMIPEASFLVWLDCRSLGMSQEELTDLFINHAHLALNNGEMYGAEGRGFMRLNVATPRRLLIHALESLAAVMHPATA